MVYYDENGHTNFKRCQSGKYEKRIFAVGDFLDDKFVICGGIGKDELVKTDCEVIDELGSKSFNMSENGRIYASYVKLNKSTIWIIGGRDYNFKSLSSTEFVTVNGSKDGPPLPFKIKEHCMVQYKEDAILLVGGFHSSKPSKKTYIVDTTILDGEILGKSHTVNRVFRAI